MRRLVCVAAIAFAAVSASAAGAEQPSAAKYWKAVQSRCDATARTPTGETGKRIAQSAVDEYARFYGHRIDSSGRLTSFGLIGAELEKGDGSGDPPKVGSLPWWRVMKYWRTLYPDDAGDRLEVRGNENASTIVKDDDTAALIRTTVSRLLKAADNETDAETREILRELAWRAAALDTPWSAAFISFVVKDAGVPASAFAFSNAHRAYIYDAFAVDTAELNKENVEHLFRACPVFGTRLRAGDLICDHRESAITDAEPAMRERIRDELSDPSKPRTVRRTHCEVVAYVDPRGRKAYTIGGNVLQGVSLRALPLRRNLKLAGPRTKCGPTPVPKTGADLPHLYDDRCGLNDKKWLVLLQMR